LVNIVKKWKDLKYYAIHAPAAVHAYQSVEEKDRAQIRVLVGKYGFVKEYSLADPELSDIIVFRDQNGFLDISGIIADDRFFQ
jgi:hypothetical protein